MDVSVVRGNQEVPIVDKDEHIKDLLSIIHDILEEGDQLPSHVLLDNFLLLDVAAEELVTIKFIAVVLQGEESRRRDLNRVLMLVVLAVAKPGSQIVSCSNLYHLRVASRSLGIEILFEFLVCDVGGEDHK